MKDKVLLVLAIVLLLAAGGSRWDQEQRIVILLLCFGLLGYMGFSRSRADEKSHPVVQWVWGLVLLLIVGAVALWWLGPLQGWMGITFFVLAGAYLALAFVDAVLRNRT